MSKRNTSALILGMAFFTVLSGFNGCTIRTGRSTAVVSSPSPTGNVLITSVVEEEDPLFMGDVALTIYAPIPSATAATTTKFNLTLREGGAFGPIAIQASNFSFDANGLGIVDITDLPYGFYDLEIVGLDFYGSSVSYAAIGVTIDEPLTVVTLDLESAIITGDVVLDLIEPDQGMYEWPIDTIDYTLWEIDSVTGQLVIVETITNLSVDPWSMPVIGALELGNYYLQLLAFDVYGRAIYEFNSEFSHDSETTFLPASLWYF